MVIDCDQFPFHPQHSSYQPAGRCLLYNMHEN